MVRVGVIARCTNCAALETLNEEGKVVHLYIPNEAVDRYLPPVPVEDIHFVTAHDFDTISNVGAAARSLARQRRGD
jgi:hypothetical protein